MEALLISGEAYAAAGVPTSALPYVLAALHHSQRLSLDLLSAQAVVALADIWLALGTFLPGCLLRLVLQSCYLHHRCGWRRCTSNWRQARPPRLSPADSR